MAQDGHICESCREAVLRTYYEMREKGMDEVGAIRSAMHVLALRHPQESRSVRSDLLAAWLQEA